MLRNVVRLAVVAFAAAAASVVVPMSPGQAATCGSASGVTVVVDFHQLGKGLSTTCDHSGAGDSAADLFTGAGHTLTYVDGEPFVCEVDGAPVTQCVRTPPSNAYWSLWWSDGKSGTWKYAATGVTALHVPDGGYVALSWQKGNAQVLPGVAAKSHTSTTPTSQPTTRPTSKPSSHPTGGASGPTSVTTNPSPTSPTTSASPSRGRHHTHGPTQSPSAKPRHHGSTGPGGQADPPVAGVASDQDSRSGSGGLPGWVAPVAVVVLFAIGATIALLRRKSSGAT